MAREGGIDILMKGHFAHRPVVPPGAGQGKGRLRTGRLLSDMAFFEQHGEGGPRLNGG